MMKHILPLFILLLSLTACCEDNEPTPPPSVPTVSSTVLVYFIAENNLCSDGSYNYMQRNIDDMKKGFRSCPVGATWLYYLDKDASPTLYKLSKTKTGEVKEEVLKVYPDQFSTDPAVMRAVLNDAYSRFPADSLGLILSSHGNASLYVPTSYAEMHPTERPLPSMSRAFGSEAMERVEGNNYNGAEQSYTMNITDLCVGLDGLPQKLQYIFFDACLMGNIETAYELRHYAKYLVASPNSTPGTGYPYQNILRNLASMSEYDLTSAVNSFVSYYSTNLSKYDDFAASTVLRLDRIEAVATHLKFLLGDPVSQDRLFSVKRSDMQQYEAERSNEGESPLFPLYDLGLLVDSIANPAQPALSAAVRSALRQFIIRFVHQDYLTINSGGTPLLKYDERRFVGTSVYLPPSYPYVEPEQLNYYQRLQWYTDAGFDQCRRYNIPVGDHL